MKNYHVLSCLTAVALLSRCASVKPSVIEGANKSSLGVLYHAAPAEFNAKNVYSDPYLREVTPVHSVTGIGLAEWRNDQYAKVKVVTQQLMDQCLQQFEQQLPILLKK